MHAIANYSRLTDSELRLAGIPQDDLTDAELDAYLSRPCTQEELDATTDAK